MCIDNKAAGRRGRAPVDGHLRICSEACDGAFIRLARISRFRILRICFWTSSSANSRRSSGEKQLNTRLTHSRGLPCAAFLLLGFAQTLHFSSSLRWHFFLPLQLERIILKTRVQIFTFMAISQEPARC